VRRKRDEGVGKKERGQDRREEGRGNRKGGQKKAREEGRRKIEKKGR
jgi:hypothetical protein